jgi:hypothetical protein
MGLIHSGGVLKPDLASGSVVGGRGSSWVDDEVWMLTSEIKYQALKPRETTS